MLDLKSMKKLHLEQVVRIFGNSSGIIIPASVMRESDINELMENTDFESQRQNEELKEWNDSSSEGREIV